MTNMDMGDQGLSLDDGNPEIRRVDGRTRAARQARPQARDAARPALRDGQVIGRDGEILSRRRTSRSSDPYEIDPKTVPAGWEYQWVAVTVVGDGDIVRHRNLEFYDNGWRPVP